MSIGSPDFRNVGNHKSGNGDSAKAEFKAPKTSGGSGDLNIYINDNSFEAFYKSSVNTVNPVAASLRNSEGGLDESEHVQPYINIFKTCDIAIVTGGFTNGAISWTPSKSEKFGNWRSLSGILVHDNVMLVPDSQQIELGYSQEFSSFWEKIMGNKIISALDEVATSARLLSNSAAPGKAYPRYKNVPVLKDIGTVNIPSSLKFEFSWGQCGLFSCEHEVVRPILAIAKILAPQVVPGDSSSFIEGSAPSNEFALSRTVRSIWDSIGGTSGAKSASEKEEGSDESDESFLESAASKLTELQNKLYEALNKAAGDLLNSGKFKGIKLRMGRFVLPPMLVKSVKFTFDFTQVDEYGYPYKGTLTLDGLETAVTANSSLIKIG